MDFAASRENDKSNEHPLEEIVKHAQHATELLKALASEPRLMILCMLAEGEKSVGELNELMNRAQSSVSQELARLRRQQLVKARREGKMVYYSIDSEEAERVIAALHEIYCRR